MKHWEIESSKWIFKQDYKYEIKCFMVFFEHLLLAIDRQIFIGINYLIIDFILLGRKKLNYSTHAMFCLLSKRCSVTIKYQV